MWSYTVGIHNQIYNNDNNFNEKYTNIKTKIYRVCNLMKNYNIFILTKNKTKKNKLEEYKRYVITPKF